MADLPQMRVFVGDLHTGSDRGLTMTPQNAGQRWLLLTWAAFVRRVLLLSERHSMTLMLGGDLVDQPGRDARNDAIALLQPLTNRAASVWGVPGTEYHVGEDGDEDRSIYDQLGAVGERARQVHRLRVSGRVLWWAHHAVRLGGEPWTETDGLYRSAKRYHEGARSQDMPPPALVVGHHVHRSPGITQYRDTRAAVCPCWQLGTAFGAKSMAWSLPTIGGLIWYPETDGLELIRYAIPPEAYSA